jgi:hypothetical protein
VRGISDLIEGKSRADAEGSQLRAARNASAFAFEIIAKYRPPGETRAITNPTKFEKNSQVEALVRNVEAGDWNLAVGAAIGLIQSTTPLGENALFDALLKYYDCPEEDMRWGAFQVAESAVALAPDLINRETLVYLARHPDFSVRSSAASICMELASYAPTRVPVDLLIQLSIYSEDWYVQAPANAALKTLVRSMPGILRIFISRLRSPEPLEREHAAGALADIANEEPELLNYEEIGREITLLKKLGDNAAAGQLAKVFPLIQRASHRKRYRYGL